MSCTVSRRKPPRRAASHNLLKPCPSPARWNGSPSRRNRAEPLPLPRRQERQAAPTELTGDRGTDGSNPSPSSGESGELPTRLGPNLRRRFRAIDHDKGRQMAAAARQAPFCPRSSGPRWLLVAFANPREIKSECWATSSRIRGRLPSESASVLFRRQDCQMLSENAA